MHVVRQRALFEQASELAVADRGVDRPSSRRARDLGLVAVADRLDQQVAQRPALELELAEHVEDLAAERLPLPRSSFSSSLR